MTLRNVLFCFGLVATAPSVLAQTDLGSYDHLKSRQPLSFEKEVADDIGMFTNLSNRVFRAKTVSGRAPAVVVVHTCGGVKSPHIKTHAKEFMDAGYVVLVQDSFTPRGSQGCRHKLVPVPVAVGDAYQALDHLASLPDVDPQRIYVVGYSYGGLVAQFIASPASQRAVGGSARFRAAASHYGTCRTPRGMESLFRDTDRPLLLLLGDKDTETPSTPCFPLLEEVKKSGAPVEWHVYPGTTHGWDKPGEGASGYEFNDATSRDAARRTLEFFERNR